MGWSPAVRLRHWLDGAVGHMVEVREIESLSKNNTCSSHYKLSQWSSLTRFPFIYSSLIKRQLRE